MPGSAWEPGVVAPVYNRCMHAFARLYAELDASTSTQAKVAALVRYFGHANAADAAWAAYLLAGGRPRQVVPTAVLRAAACTAAGIDDWLFEECYQAVGDLAETIALVLPDADLGQAPAVPADPASAGSPGLSGWMTTRLGALRGMAAEEQAAHLQRWWGELDAAGRFLLVKLIGGGFRVGVSKLLVQRALAEVAGLDATQVAERMMGYTDAKAAPSAERFRALIDPRVDRGREAGQPYPFFLAHAVAAAPAQFDAELGPRQDWLAEWKFDGIRAQAVRRAGRLWLWSRGEELITERFPDVAAALAPLADGTVLDGEILAWRGDRPAPFALLQQRITRKTLPKKLLAEAPAVFVAYDLLEEGGADLRGRPQHERRAGLEALAAAAGVRLSPLVEAPNWAGLARQREGARERGVEGLMLKHREARYGSGRSKAAGAWWKWKIEPMTVDGVLIYAQAGHGRRAGVYTDYTFAVWSREPADAAEAQAVVGAIARREPAQPGALQLVPFTKAYSGLSDAEFAAVDREIRAHTLEKFGPVRSVRPTLVVELAFEGLQRSPRHKSGIALRFPRMLRVRHDKALHQADTLATLEALLTGAPPSGSGGAGPGPAV